MSPKTNDNRPDWGSWVALSAILAFIMLAFVSWGAGAVTAGSNASEVVDAHYRQGGHDFSYREWYGYGQLMGVMEVYNDGKLSHCRGGACVAGMEYAVAAPIAATTLNQIVARMEDQGIKVVGDKWWDAFVEAHGANGQRIRDEVYAAAREFVEGKSERIDMPDGTKLHPDAFVTWMEKLEDGVWKFYDYGSGRSFLRLGDPRAVNFEQYVKLLGNVKVVVGPAFKFLAKLAASGPAILPVPSQEVIDEIMGHGQPKLPGQKPAPPVKEEPRRFPDPFPPNWDIPPGIQIEPRLPTGTVTVGPVIELPSRVPDVVIPKVPDFKWPDLPVLLPPISLPDFTFPDLPSMPVFDMPSMDFGGWA